MKAHKLVFLALGHTHPYSLGICMGKRMHDGRAFGMWSMTTFSHGPHTIHKFFKVEFLGYRGVYFCPIMQTRSFMARGSE